MGYRSLAVTEQEVPLVPEARAPGGPLDALSDPSDAPGGPFDAPGGPRDALGDPFEALGDPNRREILRLLAGGDKPVVQIAAELPISRPAGSRHLRLLKEAGMASEQPQGTRRIYRLRAEGMQAIQTYLENVWGNAAARFRLLADNTGEEQP